MFPALGSEEGEQQLGVGVNLPPTSSRDAHGTGTASVCVRDTKTPCQACLCCPSIKNIGCGASEGFSPELGALPPAAVFAQGRLLIRSTAGVTLCGGDSNTTLLGGSCSFPHCFISLFTARSCTLLYIKL